MSGDYLASIQHLPPHERVALVLAEQLAWSPRDIAELLGVDVGAVGFVLDRERGA
jgi:RNA polymerase sigma-70 factor (ECF subfamily)